MHLMITKRKYKGKEIKHAKIVESVYRKGRTPSKRTILNLGPVNNASDLTKYSQILESMKQDKDFIDISQLSVEKCHEYGVTHVVNQILEKYGIENVLKKYICANRTKFNVYEILKLLLINRLINPSSELSAIDWADKHYSKKLDLELHHFYRTLDYLIPNKENIEQDIFNVLKKKLKLDTTKTFYDLTSTYFEGQKCNIAMFGYSRDHRRDRKQIVIGLAMCEGIPILHEVFKGNTVDKSTFSSVEQVVKKRLGIKKTTFLADSGLMTEKNISYLESVNQGYILACPRRNNKNAEEWLTKKIESDKNQYAKEIHKEIFKVNKKEMFRRYILCLDNNTREFRLEELENIQKIIKEKLSDLQQRYEKSQLKKKGKKITKESLILQANKILGKNKRIFSVRYSKGLEFNIKKSTWDYEKKIAGKFLLVTNTNVDANHAMKEYKQLQDVENAFDELKNFLDIRPIYHWKTRRVKAHVFVSVLSYLIESIIKKLCSESPRAIINELQTIKMINIKVGKKEIRKISKISDENLHAIKQLKIQLPY